MIAYPRSGTSITLNEWPLLVCSGIIWLPTVDNLRKFLLTTTTEMLSFFQQLREVP